MIAQVELVLGRAGPPRRAGELSGRRHRGSAVAGLRGCKVQHRATTPKPVWNPDVPNPYDFYAGWQEVPDNMVFDNAFKVQWELFLQARGLDEPFPWDFFAGAKGRAACGARPQVLGGARWVDVPELPL